jgi:hypothetical protein
MAHLYVFKTYLSFLIKRCENGVKGGPKDRDREKDYPPLTIKVEESWERRAGKSGSPAKKENRGSTEKEPQD